MTVWGIGFGVQVLGLGVELPAVYPKCKIILGTPIKNVPLISGNPPFMKEGSVYVAAESLHPKLGIP